MTNDEADESLSTDVLIIGGGPAGTSAAIKAAQAGAAVVLADKGHTGSSGATASVGTGIWYVEDIPELREAAMASRDALGGHLAERDWMTRVLDETHARMDELASVQRYPFPVDAHGRPIRNDLQGPEYIPHPGAGAARRRRRRGVGGGGPRPEDGPHRAHRRLGGGALRRRVRVSVQDAGV
jgi:succinate dehydrogenase/fumarate reductase flavoprotein subunit